MLLSAECTSSYSTATSARLPLAATKRTRTVRATCANTVQTVARVPAGDSASADGPRDKGVHRNSPSRSSCTTTEPLRTGENVPAICNSCSCSSLFCRCSRTLLIKAVLRGSAATNSNSISSCRNTGLASLERGCGVGAMAAWLAAGGASDACGVWCSHRRGAGLSTCAVTCGDLYDRMYRDNRRDPQHRRAVTSLAIHHGLQDMIMLIIMKMIIVIIIIIIIIMIRIVRWTAT
eukprot:scaffold1204_cov407-Prasinococcus_capsulatus_cf.AAC.6